MEVTVAFWINNEVVEMKGTWDGMPDYGVLWASVENNGYTHTLIGAEFYWVYGRMFGVVNHPKFGGKIYQAYSVDEDGSFKDLGSIHPPSNARVLEGIQVPNHVWNRLRANV